MTPRSAGLGRCRRGRDRLVSRGPSRSRCGMRMARFGRIPLCRPWTHSSACQGSEERLAKRCLLRVLGLSRWQGRSPRGYADRYRDRTRCWRSPRPGRSACSWGRCSQCSARIEVTTNLRLIAHGTLSCACAFYRSIANIVQHVELNTLWQHKKSLNLTKL